MPLLLNEIVRVLVPSFMAFTVGIAITPIISHYLYKYKAWKKAAGKQALDGSTLGRSPYTTR